MRLSIGLSPLVFSVRSGQYANSSPIELHSGEGGSGSLYSGSTGAEEKEEKVQQPGAWVPQTYVLRYCAQVYSRCQEQEGPIRSAPLRSGWPKLEKVAEGGLSEVCSVLLFFYSLPT